MKENVETGAQNGQLAPLMNDGPAHEGRSQVLEESTR